MSRRRRVPHPHTWECVPRPQMEAGGGLLSRAHVGEPWPQGDAPQAPPARVAQGHVRGHRWRAETRENRKSNESANGGPTSGGVGTCSRAPSQHAIPAVAWRCFEGKPSTRGMALCLNTHDPSLTETPCHRAVPRGIRPGCRGACVLAEVRSAGKTGESAASTKTAAMSRPQPKHPKMVRRPSWR